MRRLLCVIGALAVTAGAAGAANVTSGLRGTVYALPGGACLQGADCSKRPLGDSVLVFTLGQRSVTTTTNENGAFRVHLTPGMYSVHLGSAMSRRPVSPMRAAVVKGKMRSLTFVVAGPKFP